MAGLKLLNWNQLPMPFTFRPNILKMQPYSPGKPMDEVRRELGLTEVVKLASNENPLGPSPKAIEAVRAAAADMHLYPDASGYSLREALSQHMGIPANQILLGNGSDELLHLLGIVFLDGPEDEIVVGDPSFVRYDASAQIAGSRLVKVPVTPDYRLDAAAMARAITPRTRLVFLANPNNPTGTVNTRAEVELMLEALPSGAALVLDEAYFEFAADAPDYPDALSLVQAGRPVIALRTFSKTYGLAGIRVGYGFASSEVADALNRAREPFNVNSLAQVAAIAALEDRAHIERTVAHNAAQRDRLSEAFRRHGFMPVESYANFVLADLGSPARPLFDALLRKGVITRCGDVLGLPNTLRVSVGTELEMDRFEEALASCVAAATPS